MIWLDNRPAASIFVLESGGRGSAPPAHPGDRMSKIDRKAFSFGGWLAESHDPRSPKSTPKSRLGPCLALLLLLRLAPAASAADAPMLGFTPEAAAAERALEARFDALVEKEDLRAWMQKLSARPHHLGSHYDKENAEFIAAEFRAWGYETEIEQFDVLFPTPKFRLVQMVEPEDFVAKLEEPAIPEDKTSDQKAEQLPVYNAYSIDGDVTAQVVYVNYGVPADYEVLASRGIDVKGKIVLARYGGSWRGIKPKVAAEHGAIGCLIYSDPHEDGYFQGDAYPEGAWRGENGAQRGSVADMPLYPGDPLTPGIGATNGAKRLEIKDAPTLTKIPVIAMSYSDALPFLRLLGGPVAPTEWRGALPITYHIGPGPAKAHLKLEFNWKLTPLYDVVARVRGEERPDEWIIRGNHHDAWVNGASDPVSGVICVMEEARALGGLMRLGWRPKRTIIFAAWDGEEPGLLGSTEWVESHAIELKSHAAFYVNSDSNGRGFLNLAGSQTLERFLNEVGRDVTDPEKKISVAARAHAKASLSATPEERREMRNRPDIRMEALGSGSDYTPFLQHLGVASANLGFGGEGSDGGVYHSIYDSFDHYTRFIDPSFDYGVALVQTAGRTVLRGANADVLPFEFSPFVDSLGRYFKEVTKLADDMRDATESRNRLISDRTYQVVADPLETWITPPSQDPVPPFKFDAIQTAIERLKKAAAAYDSICQEFDTGKLAISQDAGKLLDSVLLGSERAMTLEAGLPRRPWYKHMIYAPGFYTGYGVKTLPGVREAIEQRSWSEANEQIIIAAQIINRVATEVEQSVRLVRQTPPPKGVKP